METDDDIVVVIVGENDASEFHTAIPIKEEVLELDDIVDVENLIETAEKHGQLISLTNLKQEPVIKEEHIDDDYGSVDYVDENFEDDYDTDYVPPKEDYLESSSQDDSDKEESRRSKPHRYKMLKPSEQKSFVRDLLQEYPELRGNNELLIETLCEIMINIKAPPPPKDYFVMNGILFECIKCGSTTETMPAAQRHWQEKHGQRYLVCFACGVDFRSKTNLYKHEKRCNAPDSVIVLKARARSLGLKGRSRPYLLDPSDIRRRQKTFRPGMKKTVKPRPPEKRFRCPICPASFTTKTALQSHQYAHTGDRPFKCPDCPAAYTSKTGLTRHYAKHTDIQFICDVCSSSFKTKTTLIAHLDTHRPLRKYACEECGVRYAQKMALQLHVDRVHRRLPPPCACQICPKRYPRMSLLKTHMLKEHGMNLITRKMFYKTLPMLSETQIKQAKVVLKSDLTENGYQTLPLDFDSTNNATQEQTNFIEQHQQSLRRDNELQNLQKIVIQQPEKKQEKQPKKRKIQKIPEVKVEIEETDADQEMELSEEVMEYVRKMQQGQSDGSTQFVVIQNGEYILVDESNIDMYRQQLLAVGEAFENDGRKQTEVEVAVEEEEVEQTVEESSIEQHCSKDMPVLQVEVETEEIDEPDCIQIGHVETERSENERSETERSETERSENTETERSEADSIHIVGNTVIKRVPKIISKTKNVVTLSNSENVLVEQQSRRESARARNKKERKKF